MTETAVLTLLRTRFAAPAFAVIPQVRNGTGWSRRTVRTADALVMGLYPSRGLHLTGVEIKVDRYDWLRELKAPDKAEDIARFCDFWVVAVGDKGIVEPGELPPNWGLLVPNGQSLRYAVEPKILTATPVDRAFLAAILRRAAECVVPKDGIEELLVARFEAGLKQGEENVRHQTARTERTLSELQGVVRTFEAAAGVKIDRWDAPKIGAAVKFVLEGGVDQLRQRLDRVGRDARGIAEHVEEVLGRANGPAPAIDHDEELDA